MKHILLSILLITSSVGLFSQSLIRPSSQISAEGSAVNKAILSNGSGRVTYDYPDYNTLRNKPSTFPSTLPMVYPTAGIAVSTGTAWAASIVNNSANWNVAFLKGVGKGSYYRDVVNVSLTNTATEILIKTKIPFLSGHQMPLIHLEGYAYGAASPIELRIAFYIYNNSFASLGCTSTCPWDPVIKMFTYVDNSVTYVGIALVKTIYYPQFTVNYIDVWGGGTGVMARNYSEGWTVEFNTLVTPSIVPTDNLATVPYRPIANDITGSAGKLNGQEGAYYSNSTPTWNNSTNVLGIVDGAGTNSVVITGFLESEVDGSISNEGLLTVAAGAATTSIINSNTSGQTGVTLGVAGPLSISESGNTITLTATAFPAEVDGSITNEGMITVSAGIATTSIINSNTSGSVGATLTGAGTVSVGESGNTITITGSAHPTTLPASDVYAWAKASTKPAYAWSEIGSKPTFATVATSGSYTDLINKPTIGTGSVTSVAMTTPTGLSVTGSPITTSGTLALGLTAGYTIPTTTQIDNFTTAYGWGNHSGLYANLAGNLAQAFSASILTIEAGTHDWSILQSTGKLHFSHYGIGGMFFDTNGAGNITSGGFIKNTSTASTLAHFDASQSIESLPTATYPNLTEISYVKGVTSNVQTQLNSKQATLVSATNIKTVNGTSLLGSGNIVISSGTTITGAATTIDTENLTADRALGSTPEGKVGTSSTTSTELGYVSGVTSSIQTQLGEKAYKFGNESWYWNALEYYLGSSKQWLITHDVNNELQFRYGATAYSMYAARLSTAGVFSVNSTMTATNFILSDRRLKEKIKPIDFKNLDKVRWVQFEMKDDSSNNTRTGVIAQELEAAGLSQFVNTAQDSMKTKSVNYTDLLVAKFAEMEQIVKQLENRIKQLENEK